MNDNHPAAHDDEHPIHRLHREREIQQQADALIDVYAKEWTQ